VFEQIHCSIRDPLKIGGDFVEFSAFTTIDKRVHKAKVCSQEINNWYNLGWSGLQGFFSIIWRPWGDHLCTHLI